MCERCTSVAAAPGNQSNPWFGHVACWWMRGVTRLFGLTASRPLDSNLIDCAKLIDRAVGSSLLVVALTVGRQEPDVLNRSTEL